MLDKNSKIYVAGHHGLVGSAIWNNLLQRGYTHLVGRSHKELDLNVHGVGGIDTWGARTLPQYTIDGNKSHHYSFMLEWTR